MFQEISLAGNEPFCRSVSPSGRSISANSSCCNRTKRSPRPKRKAKSKNSVKLKWRTTLDSVKVQKVYQNGHDFNNDVINTIPKHASAQADENNVDTVIASLVYDEDKDKLVEAAEASTDTAEDEPRSPAAQNAGNPVFMAFDQAKSVDDLYRIAEIWVNPVAYSGNTNGDS